MLFIGGTNDGERFNTGEARESCRLHKKQELVGVRGHGVNAVSSTEDFRRMTIYGTKSQVDVFVCGGISDDEALQRLIDQYKGKDHD